MLHGVLVWRKLATAAVCCSCDANPFRHLRLLPLMLWIFAPIIRVQYFATLWSCLFFFFYRYTYSQLLFSFASGTSSLIARFKINPFNPGCAGKQTARQAEMISKVCILLGAPTFIYPHTSDDPCCIRVYTISDTQILRCTSRWQ